MNNGDILATFQVDYGSGIPVYRQIIDRVAAAVGIGQFQPGDQLPTIRALCERLQVNPNTVAKAYRELELKGIIEGERGAGSFIKASPPIPAPREKKTRLKNLYERLLVEAASNGLTEQEFREYMKERMT